MKITNFLREEVPGSNQDLYNKNIITNIFSDYIPLTFRYMKQRAAFLPDVMIILLFFIVPLQKNYVLTM